MMCLGKKILPLMVLAMLFMSGASFSGQSPEPIRVFVGERTCRNCHHDGDTGNQFNIWRLSAHSKAHAALSKDSSKLMAKLSGIGNDVLDTPVCLGCHATAADTETWERNETFYIEDGIQCEFCHGPGSDYARMEIMSNPEAARLAGLKTPDESFCMNCHEHKGSHQARMENSVIKFNHPVPGEVYFDYEKSFRKIAHPLASKDRSRTQPVGPSGKNGEYAGVMACKNCHSGESGGHIYSKWRLSRHSDAYAELGSPRAFEMAAEKGINGNPQESLTCLSCHGTGDPEQTQTAFEEGFDNAQGVQCESCHGPGKAHATLQTKTGSKIDREDGLTRPDRELCIKCHKGYHGESFEYPEMLEKVTHSKTSAGNESAEEIVYKTPFNMAISHDGTRLLIACEASGSMIVVDTAENKVIAEVPVMKLPHGICLSPDEKVVYVSNRGSDTISVINLETYKVIQTMVVGDEPHDLTTNGDGTILYVANTGSNDISVMDLSTGKEIKRLSGGRGTWGMDLSPDNQSVYVTNNLSHFVDFRASSRSEITVIDTDTQQVKDRIMVADANLIQGIDMAPNGEFGMVTLLRTKNLVPIVRVIQGWMITNGVGILWKNGEVDQLLIDGVDDHFSDPTDIVITPDSQYAFVTGGGVNEVAVLDIQKIKDLLNRTNQKARKEVLPNHLGVSQSYVLKRIKVGHGPRGLVVSDDGRFVYVADALSDTISVIDVKILEKVGVIDLGGPEIITQVRTGERTFHSANVTWGRQYSCHSCHPDGGIDGLSYDISADGLGLNPVDNRTLKGILDTAPFKWTGKNPSLSRQCGPRLAVFFTRIDPFTPEEARDLESYICTIPRNPNRYLTEGTLTDAQRRGKILFQRTRTNSGGLIPLKDRCNTCHSGPYFTNRKPVEVGTRFELDTNGLFDVPHLSNIYETAPYLHDGRANTLEEIWTRFNLEDKHGITNDMTKDQLNDLIEYLKIL